MKIAIAGAGFSGLACAYHLRNHNVTVFDPGGIGAGASGASSGLLHPFPGDSGRMSPRAREGMQESLRLIAAAETALGAPVCDRSGITRIPTTDAQTKRFAAMPQKYEGLTWDGEKLFIENGLTVFPKKYLQGLLKASEAAFVQSEIRGAFDITILAIGAAIRGIDLPIQCIKGQILQLQGKTKATISSGYLAPTQDPDIYHFGSTYEHNYDTEEPDMQKACALLQKKYGRETLQPLACKAGIRVSHKGNPLPILHQKDPTTWVLTGMGSRGLLYHALMAKELAQILNAEDTEGFR